MMMNQHSNLSRRSSKPRKGVAMLLVLISLMTATVLTAAYLASRDNSGAIGENIANASAARWGAASGLDIALTMLETETDWRTAHSDGLLVPNYPLGQCTVDLSLEDMEYGAPPGADTTYVRMLSIAAADDIEHEASATIIVPVTHVANVDLSEFALFAAGNLELKNQARLTRWSEAPLSDLGLPIAVGTLATTMGAVTLGTSALAIDSTAWLPPGATANTISNSSALEMNAQFMDDAIALPAPPEPVVSGPVWWPVTLLPDTTHELSTYNFQLTVVELLGTVTLSYANSRALIVDTNLTILSDSKLRVSGDATIIVHGDLRVEGTGAIEVVGDGSLRIFVGGNVDMRGYLGEAGGRSSGPNSDGLGHAQTSRIHLMSMDSDSELDWRMRSSSLVKANLYAPDARLRIADRSRLCGRAVAGRIEVSQDAVIYYDHALDRRTGYTNPASPIYGADGRIKQAFTELESLDDADLSELATSTGLKIRAINMEFGTEPTLTTAVAEGESTPRPVAVSLSQLSYDTAVTGWED